MAKIDVWPAVRLERGALATDLSTVDEAAWDVPSLCEGWTVRDVLAHMTASAKVSGASFFPKLIASGFSLSRMQQKDIAVERGASAADSLNRFKAIVPSTTSPPGPKDTWLGETIVHAEDIRRALGMRHDYATDAVVRVADFYKGSNLVIGAKKRIAGLTLRATDTAWTHGAGPEVAGPILSLVMAMAGRRAAIADLSGDGVATLSSR